MDTKIPTDGLIDGGELYTDEELDIINEEEVCADDRQDDTSAKS